MRGVTLSSTRMVGADKDHLRAITKLHEEHADISAGILIQYPPESITNAIKEASAARTKAGFISRMNEPLSAYPSPSADPDSRCSSQSRTDTDKTSRSSDMFTKRIEAGWKRKRLCSKSEVV